jgi:hypothetical protein
MVTLHTQGTTSYRTVPDINFHEHRFPNTQDDTSGRETVTKTRILTFANCIKRDIPCPRYLITVFYCILEIKENTFDLPFLSLIGASKQCFRNGLYLSGCISFRFRELDP